MRAGACPGFYGKVPSTGDFIRRRLSRTFVDPWHAWLQGAIAASREALGEDWLAHYLTSPIWRFALPPGLCGEAAAGVFMPSVDSIGRYFPMTITAPLVAAASPLALAAEAGDWFAAAEEAALFCLEDAFTVEDFEAHLARLGPPPAGAAGALAPLTICSGAGLGWRLPEDALDALAARVYPALAEDLLRGRFAAYSLWWTQGSDKVKPSLVIYTGMPPAADFAGFLSGRAPDD